jgi:hypothetical protein
MISPIKTVTSCVLVMTLLLAGCSIDLDRPAPTVPAATLESSVTAPSTALLPATQIPVTWAHLNLTGKLIYLSSTRESDTVTGTIQMLDLASGHQTTLFSMPRAWVYYAALSSDSRSMVMSYTPPPHSNASSDRILYHMPLDGSTPPEPLFTPPTTDDRYIQAEWSPDGQHLYIVHYNVNRRIEGQLDPVYDILRMQYPDGQPEQILDHAFWPRVSPDSARIVYIAVDPVTAKNDLFVANADGSEPQRVALTSSPTPEIIDAPLFSPDGQSILFSVPSQPPTSQRSWFEQALGIQVARAHDVPSDWWSVPVTGGKPTQLTNIQTINLFASLSPDETRIASMSGEGLFVMDLDGSSLTQLVTDPEVHGTVSWIP